MYWAQAIGENLRQQGVQVDSLLLPIVMDPLLLPEQIVAYRLLDVENTCDVLLTIGYPAFALKHPHKRALLFSLASPLYEWYNTEYGVLASEQYDHIRYTIAGAEKRCLQEAERILCGSKTLTSRLKSLHGLKATTMIMDHGLRFGQANELLPGEELRLVCESTLEPFERTNLLLDALALSAEAWLLHLFIPSASEVYYRALEQQIERLDLKERVMVTNEVLSEASLAAAFAYAALPYAATRIPEAVIRAVTQNVPLIATYDSGAILEIVQDKRNGAVVYPSAITVAQAVDKLAVRSRFRERLSHANQRFARKLSGAEAVVKGLMA
jgi:glycosyltransferase involved in cell wall biosynthesis